MSFEKLLLIAGSYKSTKGDLRVAKQSLQLYLLGETVCAISSPMQNPPELGSQLKLIQISHLI